MSYPKLVFLGTGAAVPSRLNVRHDTCTWLSYGKKCNILIDCGEGVKYNLLRAKLSRKIHHIFFTHDHYDHILGLTGMLAMISLTSNTVHHIIIYGPQDALNRARSLINLIRSTPGKKINLNIRYKPVLNSETLYLGSTEVLPFATFHRSKNSFGYVFKNENGGRLFRKIVFTGDTKYESFPLDVAQNASLVVANTNFALGKSDDAGKYGHLSVMEAAELAKSSNVEKLILQHLSPRYEKDRNSILVEARKVFQETYFIADLEELVT